jgi:phosphocarrier protein HPr
MTETASKDAPLKRSVTIPNQRGLHARAAAKDGQTVNGESIMGLMMLAGTQGSSIEITASGAEAGLAMEALVTLIEGKFGEPE